ncbi:MAG TPA: GtrA family protein [Streptosporangiaceae bacterium]
MTSVLPRMAESVRAKLRTSVGKRFSRFVLVAIASLATSLLTLSLLLGVFHLSAGLSGVLGAITGAAVSYVLSRWAWERKGRPSVLKETVPFWLVSLGAWAVLGLTSHYASLWALSMGHSHWDRVVIVDGAYLIANCMTFLARFLIFHYLLFADRGSGPGPSAIEVVESEMAGPGKLVRPGPLAASGSGGRLGGSSAWGAGERPADQRSRASAEPGTVPEPGTRR